MTTYYFGLPLLTAGGEGTAEDPWNQLGFNQTSTVFTASDQLDITDGFTVSLSLAIGNSFGSLSGRIALSDTTVEASVLNSLASKTSGIINASAVTTLIGTAADVINTYAFSGITGLGDEAVTLSGGTSVADANSVDSQTTGVVTATISDTTISSLSGLSGTGNAYTITVGDASVDAAALNTLDGKTTVTVNASDVGTLTGSAAAIDTAINATTIDTGAAVLVNVNSGSATVAQANSIDAQTSGVVTATISQGDLLTLATLTGDNTLVFSGANQGTIDRVLSFSAFESVNLDAGNDIARFTSGDSLSGSLAGGSGTDSLDYSSYGSAVTVNLDSGTATGTGAISGFETVLGSSAADTITASTSSDVNLQGADGNDTFNFTVAGLSSTDSVDGGSGTDTLVFSDAGTITDGQFTNVSLVESVTLTGETTLTAGTGASQAGIATITTGISNTTVNTSLTDYDLSIDTASLADGASLTLTGSASSNDFTVNNLTGNVLAGGTSGSLTINMDDATDNAIGITTGKGNATFSGSGAGDEITVNADAMADNTTLAINGSARYVVSNLGANLDAAGSSGTLSISYSDVTDNAATLVTGSGNLVVDGGDKGDTVTVTGLSANNQSFNAQASSSNFDISADGNNQTITGSNTGNDTIAGGGASETLSYAGGSNVDVTITDYSKQAGGSTGQGTDTFSGIESLVGASGNDTLRGTASATDEVATITGANSGSLRDSDSTGSFNFSSFEQLDLQDGNDILDIIGSSGGVSLSSSVDLGSGNNTLSLSDSAGSIASLSSGSGDDSLSISAGSITGALDAGDGSNTLTISGSSSSIGSYSGGTGNDSLTLSAGDVSGDVSFGTGTNTLLISSSSSTVGGQVSFGDGTADTLSYAGYGSAVSVNLSDITSNAGSTEAAGATAIIGTTAGFETLVGGSTSSDTLTDSTGDSTVLVTGANSGTIDGLAFSSFENLSLSSGNDTVTVSGNNSGVSLTSSLDLGDGTNSLTMEDSAGSISSVTSGTGHDTVSISAGSVTGAVIAGDGTNSLTINGTSSSIGSYTSGIDDDSVTLSGGDVIGNVSTGSGDDTELISSTVSTIGGNLDMGDGNGDTLSYAGLSNAVSVTLTDITSNAGQTAAGGATSISGTASGFEKLVGGSNSGDTVTDSTGDTFVLISGANSGTIDGLAFSAIENLNLLGGIDGVTVTTGGSLSGNLNLGAGTSNTVQMNSAAGAIGSLTSGSGNDTITIDGGSVTGAISTGDGDNSLTINNTDSSIGSYTGGSDVDTVVSKGGDINGAISTGLAADSVTLSLGSKVTGDVTLGPDSASSDGNDQLSLDASSITGNVITGSAADLVSVLNTSTITGDLTTGSDGDSYDGADSITVTGTSSSSKSVITGSITTGADADSVSFTDATIGGDGQSLSLGSDNNGLDGNDSLGATGTEITATITTGSGSDSVSLTDSTVIGSVTMGANADTTVGNTDTLTLDASSITGNVDMGSGADTVTLTNGSSITGNVTLGSDSDSTDGNDTLNLSSGEASISGDVSFGSDIADLISYQGRGEPITFTVSDISADSTGTGSSDLNRAGLISGVVSGYETVIGSDATGSSLITGDVLIDDSGASLAILTNNGAGTLDNLDFAAFENLRLGSGDDVLRFEGSVNIPGALTGRVDGGGVDGAVYSYGLLSKGEYQDSGTDLLDYRVYEAGSVTVDLSQNLATGVYGGLAGGLTDATGTEAVFSTSDSSFENVFGSSFSDSITADAQDNLVRGYGANDTIFGLQGNDTIDGGDNTSGPDGADLIVAGDGADLILASDGNDFISGGGYYMAEGQGGVSLGYVAEPDLYVDTLSYLDENEGLDISLAGTDAGTVKADAAASLSIGTFTNTYSSSGAQTISVLTNQTSTDWTDTYGDIQRLVLTSQNDILRLGSGDFITLSDPQGPNGDQTFSVDAGTGALDTLDFSSFASDKPVYVNLSASAYIFDFDANRKIDTTAGEITLSNPYSATNINVDPALVAETPSEGAYSPGAFGGRYGVNNFEVVVGGAADDAIVGNDAANILVGNDGADRLAGGAGNDTIYGGKGDDYINPGEGADIVNGGQGINTILITSSDLSEDTFAVDPNGINIFKLNGDGSSSNPSQIDAPSGNWNPGAQGIDLLDGGDPVVDANGNTIYDTIKGTSTNDTYQFGNTAFKNIQSVDLGAGDDSVGTAPTSKGIKISYDGGTENSGGGDSITLTLTFNQFARLNQSGSYVADVQNYIDDPNGKTFNSNQADFTATNFEAGGVQVIAPAIYNALQGDPAAITFNSSFGLQDGTITSGANQAFTATANATSNADANSIGDLVSAFVQANLVKGADAVTVTSGGNLSGSARADQSASASATTVDNRSDAVLSAYGLGVDRSAMTAGGDIQLSLSGTVKAATTGQSVNGVVNANGTSEAGGSRDSSFKAGEALDTSATGTITQTVSAAVIDGLAIAGLASRTYGIDDANLTDASTDSVQAGSNLDLTVSATDNSKVSASGVGTQALGPITPVDNGVATTDRFSLPSSLWGAAFPLINGDRIRFATTPTGGSLEANRDYFVLNVIPFTGEFQLSSTPAGDPIDVVTADSGTPLDAFRPAVSTADAISSVTAVDLNRTGVGIAGVQAGETMRLEATANDSVRATASSVAGEATAGVNRLGGLDNLDVLPVSSVVALTDTTAFSGGDASMNSVAGEAAYLQATSTLGDALGEGNVQVLGSDSSSINAGADLTRLSSASLSLIVEASSTDGRADARSGAGAGAGSSTGFIGNALPDASTYALASGITDSDQSAGSDLSVRAKATTELTASARTVGGSTSLNALWSANNVLSTFDPAASTPSLIGPQYLADGQEVQLDAGNASALGLDGTKDYVVRLLATTGVDTSDTGATANTVTMPTGISYSDGDAIRFRLNSTTVANASASRYGLELGTTYYVKGGGSSFQLATAPGGPAIDLTDDTSGLDDQLVDSDRFQLLEPPALPGAAYTVATLTPVAGGGLSVVLPSESNALAGSRQAGITLADPSALDLAQLNAMDGSGLAGSSGLMSLLSGASSTITAFADGVLNALSRNVASDATASAGLLAEGIRDTAITAGSDGTVNTRATIAAVADASTIGDSALLDNSLANLNVSATGLTAGAADQDITIAAAGDLQFSASLSGRSTASAVLGDSDALATLQATGLEALNAGFSATIGQHGDITASAVIGSVATPLLVEAISAASGDATAQAASTAIGILGSFDAPSTSFSNLLAGAAQGDIAGSANVTLQLKATAVDGAANVSLRDVSGLGSVDISGIKDMALTAGADLSRIDASAIGRANLLARSVELDATSSGSTTVNGLFSSDSTSALPVSFAQNGKIAALAQQSSFSQSISVNGSASSSLSNDSTGIGNASITIVGGGVLDSRAISQLDNRAQSVAGSVSA